MWSHGFLQMNSLWLTSEVEPFTSAELNDRLPMCAKHIQFDVHVYHIINFPLEPGIGDSCVFLLHIHTIIKYKLFWMMGHCSKQLWRYWIYKRWVTHHHIIVSVTNWLIEQFYCATFWHSKVKTNTLTKYHIQVYDLKYTIKSVSITVKTMTSTTVKTTIFNRKMIQSYNVHAIHH